MSSCGQKTKYELTETLREFCIKALEARRTPRRRDAILFQISNSGFQISELSLKLF